MKHTIKLFLQDEAGMISLTFVTMVAVVLFIAVFLIQFAGLSVLGYLDAMAGLLHDVHLAM